VPVGVWTAVAAGSGMGVALGLGVALGGTVAELVAVAVSLALGVAVGDGVALGGATTPAQKPPFHVIPAPAARPASACPTVPPRIYPPPVLKVAPPSMVLHVSVYGPPLWAVTGAGFPSNAMLSALSTTGLRLLRSRRIRIRRPTTKYDTQENSDACTSSPSRPRRPPNAALQSVYRIFAVSTESYRANILHAIRVHVI